MKIHCLQHVEYENLGCIREWCDKNGHPVSYTRFYNSDPLPDIENFDWLIIMGGPMGVYEDEKYKWLPFEKQLIKKAIEQNKTVLGICLGAQLVADVLGSHVYRNSQKEIGWFKIGLTEEGADEELFRGMNSLTKVFHWHGDTFVLPEHSKHIAFSEACRNQAFLYREKVVGLQFHFEVTAENIGTMVAHGQNELEKAAFVQTGQDILSENRYFERNNRMMFQILDKLTNR